MKLLIIFLSLLLIGCTTTAVVNTEVDPSIPQTTKFFLIPSENLAAQPMRARQVIGLLHNEMIKQGFTPAESGSTATLGVIVDLTNFPKETFSSTGAVPISGVVSSGGVSTFSGYSQSDFVTGNSRTYSGSVYTPPQYGTVGVVPITRSTTVYPLGIRLSASNMNLFRKTKRPNTAWISVIIASPTSADTRSMVPKLIKALGPWIGKDTVKYRTVYLNR